MTNSSAPINSAQHDVNSYENYGLTNQEIAEKITLNQTNYYKKFTTRTIPGILHNNIITVFNGIIGISVIALLLIQVYMDAFFIAIISIANILLGIIGELRAKWALDRLALLQSRSTRVIREGKEETIPVEQVVQDDLIFFSSGEQIIADGPLISSSYVDIDESLLTGEQDTIQKQPGDLLLSGSFCISGSGRYKASAIGLASHINQLAEQAKSYKILHTPLQKNINIMMRTLSIVLVISFFLLLLASYTKEVSVSEAILSLVTAIKALVPEGLVLITTLSFALGALRIAQKHILVQKLYAIESTGHLTTLCLDKTGTLGTNHILFNSLVILSLTEEEVTRRLKLFIGGIKNKNRTAQTIEHQFPGLNSKVVNELPFSSERKVSAITIDHQDSQLSLWLGFPEVLAGKIMEPIHIDQLKKLREQGMRVILFASTTGAIPNTENLQLLAFVVLRDELRTDVAKAIQFYESRNVAIKILSGDHPSTIFTLATQAGIAINGKLVNGSELQVLAKDDLKKTIIEGQFFGNLTPQQKKEIIQCLQDAGQFVAMVGDGVNDVLALKQADIGIAMNSGSAASKDVADVVLLQDSFAHLPNLFQEGDKIIYNIKRISKMFFTKSIYLMSFIFFTGFIGLPFPLSPRSVTLIDVLTIGIPITVLTPFVPILGKQTLKYFLMDVIKFALVAGITISLLSVLVYTNFHFLQDRAEQYGKTASIVVIVLLNLYIVFHLTALELKKMPTSIERWIIALTLITPFLLLFPAIYWSPACDLLGLASIDADSWITIIGVSITGMWALRTLFQKIDITNSSNLCA